ncbi:hypothetical protein AB0B25_21095 [Nocardia sp. NPDC049190]
MQMFLRVPDKNPDKNVIHLDLLAADQPGQAHRAIGLDTRRVADVDEYGG